MLSIVKFILKVYNTTPLEAAVKRRVVPSTEESANDAPTTSASAVDSGPAECRSVTFYAVMSTEPHEFVSRPSQKMLDRLTKVFKRPPVWMEDTVSKTDWASVYDCAFP